jgi:hypothetical protein
MDLEQALQSLANHESFYTFINTIHQLREESIGELYKADYDNLHQVSGKILAYDQLLQMADHETLKRRFG